MSRLLALLATAGCLYVAIHSLNAGLRRNDYIGLLFAALFLVLAIGFSYYTRARETT